MKRYLLAGLVALTVMPGAAAAHRPRPRALQEMKSQAPSPGMNAGMMGQGMMSGIMGQGKDMMGGCMMPVGMMGPGTMGAMMPGMMDEMLSGKTRGCMMLAEGMMKGRVDLNHMRKALVLSDEQAERLEPACGPSRKRRFSRTRPFRSRSWTSRISSQPRSSTRSNSRGSGDGRVRTAASGTCSVAAGRPSAGCFRPRTASLGR